MKSVIQENLDYCPICYKKIPEGCGDWHHIYNGTANRKKSEEDGMKIYIHRQCHMDIHVSKTKLVGLQAYYQPKWIKIYNKSTEEFIKRYGQDYIVRYEQMRKDCEG